MISGSADSLLASADFQAALATLLLGAVVSSAPSRRTLLGGDVGKYLWPSLALLSLMAWLATFGSMPGFGTVVHYGAIAGGCAALLGFLADLQIAPRRKLLLSGAAATLLLMLLYAWRETYQEKWVSSNAAKYEDTHRRWGGGIVYRRVVEVADEGMGWNQGPMVDGKRQGRWEHVLTRPPNTIYQWYWQDKPVSEEEFNQLNK